MKKFVYLPLETFEALLEHVPEDLRVKAMHEHQTVIKRARSAESQVVEVTSSPTPQTKIHQTFYKPGGGTKRDSGTLGKGLFARLD